MLKSGQNRGSVGNISAPPTPVSMYLALLFTKPAALGDLIKEKRLLMGNGDVAMDAKIIINPSHSKVTWTVGVLASFQVNPNSGGKPYESIPSVAEAL